MYQTPFSQMIDGSASSRNWTVRPSAVSQVYGSRAGLEPFASPRQNSPTG